MSTTPIGSLAGFRHEEMTRPLASLAGPETNLLRFSREVPLAISRSLFDWALRGAKPLQIVSDVRHLPALELPEGLSAHAEAWIRTDILFWVNALSTHASERKWKIFFGPIYGERCSKFHVDYVRYRLITTYVGPGTEWVPDDAVDRAALEHPPLGVSAANRLIVRDEAQIQRASTGEVLVLKGKLEGDGAVHRSPLVMGTGQVRVVLIVSTVDDSRQS
jgi:hypothetical protein